MMKRIVKIVMATCVTLLAVAGCQMVRNSGDTAVPVSKDSAVRVATYNVHYIIMAKETGAWSMADWDRRKAPLDAAFKAVAADVIGFQEMESFAGRGVSKTNLTLDWLLANNPDYGAAAVGDPEAFPSTQPILYRRDRVDMVDQGWFFFSDTPDVIYSRTFNGSFPAFASWAQFRDRGTGKRFRVINIHTDFSSRSNRRKSVELVAARMKPWVAAGESVVVIGDMNARAGNEVVTILEGAGVRFADVQGSTYHLNRGLNLFGAIDHIGIAGTGSFAGDPVVVRKQFLGEWPTDHYPVIADIQF